MNLELPHSLESIPEIQWIRPTWDTEKDEAIRVASKFGVTSESQLSIVRKIEDGIERGELVELTADVWSRLENTDSWKISTGDFLSVRNFSEEYGRDDQKLLEAMKQGKSMEVPVIAQFGDVLHLVSGNTRLMITKAIGKIPRVIFVRVDEAIRA